jgi:hypothetical protein
MLRDVALNVELEFNKMNTQLFESDIQRYMDDFLRSNLKNTDCYPHREACNKTDLVVFQTHDDGGKKQKKGIIFFEIKTVFKNHESFLHNNFVEKIRKDLCKLKDIKEKYSRAFFVLVFRKNKVNDMDNMQDISAMINNKLASKSYQKHFSITVKDEKVNVRASRKCIIDNTAVLSWEIID